MSEDNLVKRLADTLAKFTDHYDPKWMEPPNWATKDEGNCNTYSSHTFGDLREARKLVDEARTAADKSKPEIYWSGTEEQQHRELAKACKARCKQYGKADCPRPDHWCDECEHDQAVTMQTTDPDEIAAIQRGDL